MASINTGRTPTMPPTRDTSHHIADMGAAGACNITITAELAVEGRLYYTVVMYYIQLTC